MKIPEKHEARIRHAAHAVHLLYFGLVAVGGPYYVAAGGCLVFGVVAWVLHIEGVE